MTPFNKITAILLYFPGTCSFSVRSKESEAYNEEVHTTLLNSKNESGKRSIVKMKSMFDGIRRSAIIVQVGIGNANLKPTEVSCQELKKNRNLSMEDIIQTVTSICLEENVRQKFRPLSVSLLYIVSNELQSYITDN